jgi:hypothetical protein
MGLHQTKKLLQSKGTVTRLKREPTEWEKIFGIYTYDKGLITRIHRELKKLCKNISPLTKWANELNGQFPKYMKKCSISLAIKEIQIKIKISPHSSQNGYHQENK